MINKKQIKKAFKDYLNKLPYVRTLYKLSIQSKFPAGHFYSPIVDWNEVKENENLWTNKDPTELKGIDFNNQEQIELVREFQKCYFDIPWSDEASEGLSYYFKNIYYSYTDGIFLYSMIRHFKPKRIIEIGSGFSSALMADTNKLFFDSSINLTFIEPFPTRLKSLLKKKDLNNILILEQKVQNVPHEIFEDLQAGDFLFIDSSHVSKTGSDVNHILFNILPRIRKGVFIHFHDIFYPFEYPRPWVNEGRNWNEIYLLRAFLMNNSDFKIKLFSSYLHALHKTTFKNLPLCYQNTGGNLWLEKLE
ncbi:class I SAM-dependent methyltransferase [Antarcticibacterium sp. 1MA-6-2]|uniref:class I SAM-dependent methyltransferase n=1 Tax=Antarcticibacterium sp. 1MA-6-2 TaxID=2908210 RepID=UPI001F2A0EE0|nr:class I SAM-dependent methyltransferase [Antarcticibacterium sp. 1MA-6-2]UJH92529.1 class I SAM-dependent methyltransferase [Antarcticibacterium sp. 1MA-6-2]